MTLCLTFKKWRIHLVVQDEGFSVLSQRFDPAMRYKKWGSGGIGRRAGPRSQWVYPVWVRVPPSLQKDQFMLIVSGEFF